jgi:uncharacterized protein (DUF1778 family)
MSAAARFDLKMDVAEKEVVSRAAALVGTTMAITMSEQDFQAFTKALNGTFTPNAALENALRAARKMKRA